MNTIQKKPHIVIVEDDLITRELYQHYLTHSGLSITAVESLAGFLALPNQQAINLVLLDLNLPDGDGMQLLKKIHQQVATGVIVVTSRKDEVDRIRGLDLGADDFVVKPISPREIYARIQAVLRRTTLNSLDQKQIQFAHFAVDRITRKITTLTGKNISLTNSEFSLLEVFIDYSDQPLSREFLQDKVSAYSVEVHSRLVDTLVSRLRKKLNTKSYNSIHTVYGLGYQFYSE